jgi:hypothetical protein
MSRASFLLPILFFQSVIPGSLLAQPRPQEVLFKSGNIQVKHGVEHDGEKNMLLRDQINFGWCFTDAKYRRMPVTYYHPQGPIGLAFQKFNWFLGNVNTYHADARLPASLVALGACAGPANLPLSQMTALWSEPPVAVIGMEAGTPASYARPFQHFHFYEPTKEVIALNERKGKDRFFHFIPDARARGAAVRIFPGAPRGHLSQHGPRNFYHLMLLEACSGEDGEKIFLELLTKEGIAQCLDHLVDDGVLCVHTSHRFVNLPPVLAAVGADLKLHVRRGHDQAPAGRFRAGGKTDLAEIGHFTSEWVLLARHQRTLDQVCKTPAKYEELLREAGLGGFDEYWSTPTPLKQVCFIRDLGNLPRPVEQWMVQSQLRNNPQVDKLWR